MADKLTVVFHFNDKEKMAELTDSWKGLSEKSAESDPVAITAMSRGDEITRLELVEFGQEIGDLDFIGQVISATDLTPYLDQFKNSQEYANEHSVTIDAAYESVVLEA